MKTGTYPKGFLTVIAFMQAVILLWPKVRHWKNYHGNCPTTLALGV